MDHQPSDVVRYLLIDENLGTHPDQKKDWPVFRSSEPDKPDNCITVVDTAGFLYGRIQVSGEFPEHYGIQVLVRGTSDQVARAKARAIELLFDQGVYRQNVTVQKPTPKIVYLVHAFTKRTPVLPLGKERGSSDRYKYSLNYTVVVAPQ